MRQRQGVIERGRAGRLALPAEIVDLPFHFVEQPGLDRLDAFSVGGVVARGVARNPRMMRAAARGGWRKGIVRPAWHGDAPFGRRVVTMVVLAAILKDRGSRSRGAEASGLWP